MCRLSVSLLFFCFFSLCFFAPLSLSRPKKGQLFTHIPFTSKRTRFLVVNRTIEHARNAHSFNDKRTRARKSSRFQRVVICASVDINTAVFLSTHSRFPLKAPRPGNQKTARPRPGRVLIATTPKQLGAKFGTLNNNKCLATTNLSLTRHSSIRVDILRRRRDTAKMSRAMWKTETGRRNNRR